MKCQFCNEEKPLVEAHIIPRAFFKDFMRETDAKHLYEISDTSGKKRFIQTGPFDTNILCLDCDNHIGKWDNYAVEFFRKSFNWERVVFSKDQIDPSCLLVKDYDYKQLKLFFISLIWRMSISSVGTFEHVQLGRYERQALTMLKNQDPGTKDDFSVVIRKARPTRNPNYDQSSEFMHKAFTGPNFFKTSLVNYYRFTLNEFTLLIKVDRRPFTDPFSILCLKPSEELRILEDEFDGSYEHRYLHSGVHAQASKEKSLIMLTKARGKNINFA